MVDGNKKSKTGTKIGTPTPTLLLMTLIKTNEISIKPGHKKIARKGKTIPTYTDEAISQLSHVPFKYLIRKTGTKEILEITNLAHWCRTNRIKYASCSYSFRIKGKYKSYSLVGYSQGETTVIKDNPIPVRRIRDILTK